MTTRSGLTPRQEHRRGLTALAKIYATEFSYSNPQTAIPELQELRNLIQGYRPSPDSWTVSETNRQKEKQLQRSKPRILELLAEITSTGKVPVEQVHLKEIPNRLPFPAPFHLRENANHFLTQLVIKYLKPLKREQLTAYIKENEDELIIALIHHGEDAIFFDLPEYVTQAQVRKRMKTRLLQVIEGRHPRITVSPPPTEVAA